MTCPTRLPALLLPLLLLVSSVNASPPPRTDNAPKAASISSADRSPPQAMLLVSLEDGTVIKQTINVDADVCFKQNTSSSTLCFTQGDAIIDGTTNAVIGFEMIEERIDLVAKKN